MKLYADEPGHDVVRALDGPLVISCLARVEVVAAIWRKQKTEEITAEAAQILSAEFEVNYRGEEESQPLFLSIAIGETLLEEAAAMAAVHRLRAYDAVQLASAKAARRADPQCHTFVCFDQELSSAAATEGFGLLP